MSFYDLPLVSVITPSFNQADFIEETIESVFMQDYPNLEQIVVDGGSTDRTPEILERYKRRFGKRFRYVSETDRGQSHAINKGLKMAQGKIIGWLNSDDTYLTGTVAKAVELFRLHPAWDMVYGRGYYTNAQNEVTGKYPDEPYKPQRLFEGCIICQPAAFIRKKALENVGGVDESLHFCMDYDLWMRIAKRYIIGDVDEYFAKFRVHSEGKSSYQFVDVGLPEIIKSSLKNYGTIANSWLIEFIRGNLKKKGINWIIQQFKQYSVFGNCPRVQHMNRYNDFWVPPHFSMIIASGSDTPINRLLVSVKHPFYRQLGTITCSIYVNGIHHSNHQIKKESFILDLHMDSQDPYCLVEMVFDKYLIPKDIGKNQDIRSLSVYIEEVLPLSEAEYAFYQTLKFTPGQINKWLYAHRHPIPDLGNANSRGDEK